MCEEIPNVTVRVFLLKILIKFILKNNMIKNVFFINLNTVINTYDKEY